ncbi:MAG: hypothetical protein G01um101430_325 [Parcubacteria group bacterium Gr01-1014_30]|nr:MAG: hypothetical protein G01um101430_325 [Parcubacteria group bacterium Gr01-1014_30]
MASILPKLRELQRAKGVLPKKPAKKDRVGFVFSTKERTDFTKRTLASLDRDKGYDILWMDGSDTETARRLPKIYRFKNVKLKEYHLDIRGGPDKTIQFGLERLLELGYDWCGLIENDILFKKGWFAKLMNLFRLSAKEGIAAGAGTVRNLESRVLEYRKGYTVNWNIGAGMILFTREAAQLLVKNYPPIATAFGLYKFWAEHFGLDLSQAKELWFGKPNRALSSDFNYETVLYSNGFSAIGSMPAFVAGELEQGVNPQERGTKYVSGKKQGLLYPTITSKKLLRIRLVSPFLTFMLILFRNAPWLKRLVRRFL